METLFSLSMSVFLSWCVGNICVCGVLVAGCVKAMGRNVSLADAAALRRFQPLFILIGAVCVCVSALMSFGLPLLLPPLSASLPRLVLLLPASIHPLCLVRCSTSQPTPFSSFVTVLIEMLSEPVLLSPRERCPPCCSHFPLFYPPPHFLLLSSFHIFLSLLYSVSQRSQLISMSVNVKSLKVLQIDFLAAGAHESPVAAQGAKAILDTINQVRGSQIFSFHGPPTGTPTLGQCIPI